MNGLAFCVHREDWFIRSNERHGLRVDVLKLRIPIDMLPTFSYFIVAL